MANYFITWKNVIFHPELFFKNMPRSGGYGEPLKFAIISYIIGSFGIFILLFFMGTRSIIPDVSSSIGLSMLVLTIGLLGLVINSSIFWIFFKILGGKGTFEGTFRLVSYSSAPAVFLILPVILLFFLDLSIIGGKYVHSITNERSTIAVVFPAILVGGIVFLVMIEPALISRWGVQPPPAATIKVLSATHDSIELWHYGGDSLMMSKMHFTIVKADGEVSRPIIVNSSERFSVGDRIILSGADFGDIGDNIEIIAEHNNIYDGKPMIEILKIRVQIQ